MAKFLPIKQCQTEFLNCSSKVFLMYLTASKSELKRSKAFSVTSFTLFCSSLLMSVFLTTTCCRKALWDFIIILNGFWGSSRAFLGAERIREEQSFGSFWAYQGLKKGWIVKIVLLVINLVYWEWEGLDWKGIGDIS